VFRHGYCTYSVRIGRQSRDLNTAITHAPRDCEATTTSQPRLRETQHGSRVVAGGRSRRRHGQDDPAVTESTAECGWLQRRPRPSLALQGQRPVTVDMLLASCLEGHDDDNTATVRNLVRARVRTH
jgi:hypothetical protein